MLLLPTYKTVLKREIIQNKEVKIWSEESTANTDIATDPSGSNREFASALNTFYLRFDQFDFKNEVEGLGRKLKDSHHFPMEHREVNK